MDSDIGTNWIVAPWIASLIIKYYLRKGKLNRIYRGIYSLNKKYSQLELAQKLQPLSYVSLHTALSIHGINFQYYSSMEQFLTIILLLAIKTVFDAFHTQN